MSGSGYPGGGRVRGGIAADIAAKRRANARSGSGVAQSVIAAEARDRDEAVKRAAFEQRCVALGDDRRRFMVAAAYTTNGKCATCHGAGVRSMPGTEVPCHCDVGSRVVFVDENDRRWTGLDLNEDKRERRKGGWRTRPHGILVAIAPASADPPTRETRLVEALANVIASNATTYGVAVLRDGRKLNAVNEIVEQVGAFGPNPASVLLFHRDAETNNPDLVERIGTLLVEYSRTMPQPVRPAPEKP